MSLTSASILGAILAGGLSSRMGTDKAGLSVAGGTLLDWMHDKLRRTGLAEIVVCGAPHGFADRIPHRGPLGGLHSLGHRYPARQALVIPVDMPLVSEQTLTTLIAAGADAKCPIHYEGFVFPLLLTLTTTVCELLDTTLATPAADCSMAAFLRHAGVQNLARPARDAEFINVNTEQEWRECLATLADAGNGGGGPPRAKTA